MSAGDKVGVILMVVFSSVIVIALAGILQKINDGDKIIDRCIELVTDPSNLRMIRGEIYSGKRGVIEIYNDKDVILVCSNCSAEYVDDSKCGLKE